MTYPKWLGDRQRDWLVTAFCLWGSYYVGSVLIDVWSPYQVPWTIEGRDH